MNDCVADEPALTVTAPANGSQLSAGNTYTVAWQGGLKAGSITMMLLCTGCGSQYTAFTGFGIPSGAVTNTKTYTWTVMAGIPSSTKYSIMAVSTSDVSNFDISDTFSVNGVVPGGYTWVVGQFGACTKTCGGGAWTRSVTCQSSSGMQRARAHLLKVTGCVTSAVLYFVKCA